MKGLQKFITPLLLVYHFLLPSSYIENFSRNLILLFHLSSLESLFLMFTVQGILPESSEIFERGDEDVEDSDLEEQINLADELLAELDRGLLKRSNAEENEGGSADEMESKGEDKKDDEEGVPIDEVGLCIFLALQKFLKCDDIENKT